MTMAAAPAFQPSATAGAANSHAAKQLSAQVLNIDAPPPGGQASEVSGAIVCASAALARLSGSACLGDTEGCPGDSSCEVAEARMRRLWSGLAALVVLAGAGPADKVHDGKTAKQWAALLNDPDAKVRAEAGRALGAFGPEAVGG